MAESSSQLSELHELVISRALLPFLDPFDLLLLRRVSHDWQSHVECALHVGVQCPAPSQADVTLLSECRSGDEAAGDGHDVFAGCFHRIGTRFGSAPWSIWRVSSLVHVTSGTDVTRFQASDLRWQRHKATDDEQARRNAFNSGVVNLLHPVSKRVFIDSCSPDRQPFFCVDVGPFIRIRPTAYWLRHGSSQCRVPRSWRLEGSSDGLIWTVLREHTDDTTISEEQHSHAVFDLPSPAKRHGGFRLLRLVKTGCDAGEWDESRFFHVNGFEVFGEMVFSVPTDATVSDIDLSRPVMSGWLRGAHDDVRLKAKIQSGIFSFMRPAASGPTEIDLRRVVDVPVVEDPERAFQITVRVDGGDETSMMFRTLNATSWAQAIRDGAGL